ncbi:MAG: alpha/beta fold hydrolase [Bauldia sp.]
MTKYCISVRGASGDAFTSDPEVRNARYLKIPDGEVPAPRHAIPRTQWVREIIDDLPVKEGVRIGDLLFLVHGFNNEVDEADALHRKVQKGIDGQRFACRVISFDWPSYGEPLAYLPDRDLAVQTSLALVRSGVRVLRAALDERCQTSLHLLAHSMGALVVREALTHGDDDTASSSWSFSQVALAAGDISSQSMTLGNPDTSAIFRHCYRLTNYFNGFDEVLQISNAKRVGLSPRVGRIGLPEVHDRKAVDVDCSRHFEENHGQARDRFAKSHSWFFDDKAFYEDLTITLRGALDRDVIPTRDYSGPVAALK